MSCTGVFSKSVYSLRLDVRSKFQLESNYLKISLLSFLILEINFNRFIMFVAGMIIFLIAPTVCKKVAFHYTTGTLVGVLGSILIIVYLTSRLIPKVRCFRNKFFVV